MTSSPRWSATFPRSSPLAERPSFLGNWEIPAGAGWDERPQSWASPDADVWFIQREQVGPEQYAETWLQDASESRDRRLYQDSYAAYLDDFAARDVAGDRFRDDLAAPAGRGCGGRCFPVSRRSPTRSSSPSARTWAPPSNAPTGWPPTIWRPPHLLVAEDVTEERHQRPGAEHPGVILLRQGAGLRRTNLLSTELAGFVSACDGDLSVGQIIGALEALLGGDEGWDGAASSAPACSPKWGTWSATASCCPPEPERPPRRRRVLPAEAGQNVGRNGQGHQHAGRPGEPKLARTGSSAPRSPPSASAPMDTARVSPPTMAMAWPRPLSGIRRIAIAPKQAFRTPQAVPIAV